MPEDFITKQVDETSAAHQLDALVFALVHQMQAYWSAGVQEFELSLPQAMALRLLQAEQPMRDLAGRMGCDASYITGLADSLEQRGLLERRPDPVDRRVKQLALTTKGLELQRRLHTRLVEQSPLVTALTLTEQQTLVALLERVIATSQSER